MREPHFEIFFSTVSGMYRELQRLRNQFSEEVGVKSVHIFWVYLLHKYPEGLTAAELAEASQTTSSLISREIQELIESDMIYHDEVPGKRRYGWKFHLTHKGRALAAEIDRVAINVQTYVSKDIPQDQLEIFYRVLSKLLEGFVCYRESNTELSGGNL